jgi:hypothetical protein
MSACGVDRLSGSRLSGAVSLRLRYTAPRPRLTLMWTEKLLDEDRRHVKMLRVWRGDLYPRKGEFDFEHPEMLVTSYAVDGSVFTVTYERGADALTYDI